MTWLLGIRDVQSIETHASRGALFETWVVSEAFKQKFHNGQPADLFFWRDSSGHEVDLLEETPDGLQATEIKSGTTFTSDWMVGLSKWRQIAGAAALHPTLVYGGDDSFERAMCCAIMAQSTMNR